MVYVHGIGNYLYGMILESIDREGKWGKALLTSVINADATIQGRAGRLVDHIIRAGTNMTIDQAKVRMMEIDAMKINMSDTPEEMELTYNDLLAK